MVVEQLEQERQESRRRLQRVQERVKGLEKERDTALKKLSEYKGKLSGVKEGGRKETAALQTQLAKV